MGINHSIQLKTLPTYFYLFFEVDSMPPKAFVFDAYGTLFDLTSPTRKALEERDRNNGTRLAQKVANDWRLKQLQYTWIRAITGFHTDFWKVTTQSLDWALENSNLHHDSELRTKLLSLYQTIDVYPEVVTVLSDLKAHGHTLAILSNGNPEMLATAAKSSGINQFLDAILSVEDVGIFKPSHKVYELVIKQYKCLPEAIQFVSSNGWDAAAASGYGFNSVWVNRNQEPVEQLPWKPQRILPTLKELHTSK